MESVLLLEDGKVFYGEAFGAGGTIIGEVVFNTGMTGYQEIITDPSYKGQMVTMTYPHIGNYGVNPEDPESDKPHAEAFIVREYCDVPSNYRSQESLGAYMQRHGILGLHQVDTRELTRHIREHGAMMGILSSEGFSIQELSKKLKAYPKIEGRDLVCHVTRNDVMSWDTCVDPEWYPQLDHSAGKKQYRIAAYDFGIKHNILRLLSSHGFQTDVFPADTPPEKIKEYKPDGIFLSNGPGDPSALETVIQSVRALMQYKPVFGICLGHQIIGLAAGAKTYKMKFGHHGCNHPVKDLKTGVIEITSQNHNYAIDPGSMEKAGFELTHKNLNDGTVEGIRHREWPVFCVQYHPEASPGPHDSVYLFSQFRELIEKS